MSAIKKIKDSVANQKSNYNSARQVGVDQKRAKRDMYRKRKSTLVKKAYELGKLCEVDVAVIICRNGRYFTYRSLDQQSWPPSMESIVSMMYSIHLFVS